MLLDVFSDQIQIFEAFYPGLRDDIQEFMLRVLGNSQIRPVELLALDAGYHGRFFQAKLDVTLDLYFNRLTHSIYFKQDLIMGPSGLPDWATSSVMARNEGLDSDILGVELSIKYAPFRGLSLSATYAHREDFWRGTAMNRAAIPKNLMSVGGRFQTPAGWLGSLYLFGRTEFWSLVYAPPTAFRLLPSADVGLVLGRVGYAFHTQSRAALETGLKLFLPISPFQSPTFRYHEVGGFVAADGQTVGGQELARIVSAYVQGSF